MLKRPNLLISAGVLALCLVAGSVHADDYDNRALLERIVDLESQVRDMSAQRGGTQSAYGNSYGSSSGPITNSNSGNTISNAADLETRISSLETQMRNLTGQVEQAVYQTQQTNAAIQKISADMDMRLQQLEQRTSAMPTASSVPVGSNITSSQGPITNTTSNPNGPFSTVTGAPVPVGGGQVVNGTAAPPPPGGPEDLYNQAYAEMQRKEYPAALQDFKKFLNDNPNSKLAPNAQYWLGEIYYSQANYKMASATFADAFQKAPHGAKAPDNLLKLGLSLEQQDRSKDACTVFRQLVKDYPNASDSITSGASRGIKRLQCAGGKVGG